MNVLAKVLIELRDDGAVAAIAGNRIRGLEPAEGDERPKGSYVPFVVVTDLSGPRMLSLPVQRPSIGVRCYGRTASEAAELYGACSDAIHNIGPRVHTNGLGIYNSFDVSGGTEGTDPDTKQPYYEFTIEAIATTQAVA